MKRLFLCVVAIIMALSLCACKSESPNNDSTETEAEAEKSEPQYVAFNDIEIQINPESNFFYEVESWEDFSFEYYDNNGKPVDGTDEEKQDLWNNCMWGEPYSEKALQAIYTHDYIILHALPLSEARYDNIDSYVNSYMDDEDLSSKKDFNIGDVHACALYWKESEDYVAESMITFIYKDNVYILYIEPVLSDIETLTEEMMDGIKLN